MYGLNNEGWGTKLCAYSETSCAVTLTGTTARRGRIIANPILKMPYAVRTPKAIDPIAAQINITKSAILL